VLDEAAFSASGTLPPDAAGRALELYRVADAEALSRMDLRLPVALIVGALLLGTATIQAGQTTVARDAFDEGVAAYGRRDFTAARDAFRRSVVAEPGAPDAWANLGTASWAAADTAHAVAGWQRAMRMEPIAADVRDRAQIVHALPAGSAGYMPPMPAAWAFDLAAVLWFASWGIMALQLYRRRAPARRQLAALGVVAGMFILGGLVLIDQQNGRQLAVVRRTGSLSSDPMLASERGATAIIGEVVKTRGRQGSWTRIVLDDGRDGWVESSGLISLDTRDATN
jgi:hypothetical protein